MKTDVSRPFHAFWQALSEVPGWPDAPIGVRLRRIWPLALPLAACAALVVWTEFVREPLRRSARAAVAELILIEEQIEQLRQTFSDQSAADVIAQATAAQTLLLASPADLQERLQAFAVQARAAEWSATFQTYGLADDEAAGAAAAYLAFAPARVHLVPGSENADRFNSLIATLTSLAAMPGRIEITRVAIRADPSGVPLVEVNLRAACRSTHEKTAE